MERDKLAAGGRKQTDNKGGASGSGKRVKYDGSDALGNVVGGAAAEGSGMSGGAESLPQGMQELRLGDTGAGEDDLVYHARYEGDPNDAGHTIITTAGSGRAKRTLSYSAERIVGNGSFGVVFQAKCLETSETVAIKKVLQDKRFKNRELQIMRQVTRGHPNVCQLKHCFYSTNEKDEVYLNLVLEYVPETVYRISKHYSKSNQRMPTIFVRLYMYQLFRALAHLHANGVCHRDIKPQNLLVDGTTHQLKLCDFGSAKQLVRGEPNISYICSRYYRAPELIFGATDYTAAIDVWSVGCVMAELLLGQPLFPGESGVDQLVEIIKVLGTPSREEIRDMNPNYTEFKFPQIRAHPWSKVFSKRMPADALELVSRLLVYSPGDRLPVSHACADAFFDELRQQATRLPSGRALPPLFNFSEEEVRATPEEVRAVLTPVWYAQEAAARRAGETST